MLSPSSSGLVSQTLDHINVMYKHGSCATVLQHYHMLQLYWIADVYWSVG